MSQLAGLAGNNLPSARPGRTGLFVGRPGGRRAAMAAACANLIDAVLLADDPHQAGPLAAPHPPAIVIVDLEGFTHAADGAALAQLVAARAGAPTLLVCPSERASWLTMLMTHGPCEYALAPITLETLYSQVARMLGALHGAPDTGADTDPDGAATQFNLRGLLALRSRALRVVADSVDTATLAAGLCAELERWPGVVHAAVCVADAEGRLELQAQAGSVTIDLAPILAAGQGDAQTRRARFPALAAARSGELVIADAVDEAGRWDDAGQLQGHTIGTIVGVPVLPHGPGQPLGSLSLAFATSVQLTGDELLALGDIAQGLGLALRLIEANRESELLSSQLTRASTLDALTGVANRRHGEDLLEREIRRARRYALPLAVISFDIDRFKDINDRYGHPCGDMALRTVAAATHAVLRGTDMLVRAGGEEFQIIATHTSAIDGLKMAEKIRATIAQTPIPGCDRLTISLGVAQLADQESADGLTVRVNAAMARAKRAGRNCVELAMT